MRKTDSMRQLSHQPIAWFAAASALVISCAPCHGATPERAVCVTMSPDGAAVFFGCPGKVVVTDGELKEKFSFAVMEEYFARYWWVSKLAVSPDGQKLAIVAGLPGSIYSDGVGGRVSIWSVKEKTRICQIESKKDPLTVRDLTFSADGSVLAIASEDTVTWWSVKNGALLGTLQDATSPICFRSEDKEIQCAFASARHKVGIWTLADKRSRVAAEFRANEKCIAFAPGGARAAIESGLWTVERTPRQIFKLDQSDRRTDVPVHVRFSAKGEFATFLTHGNPPDLGGRIVVVDSTGSSTKPRQYGWGGDRESSLPVSDCAVSDKTETLVYLPYLPLADKHGAFIGLPQAEPIKTRRAVTEAPHRRP